MSQVRETRVRQSLSACEDVYPGRVKPEPLELVGRVVAAARDEGRDLAERLLSGRARAPSFAELQTRLAGLDAAEKALVVQVTEECLVAALHSLLFAMTGEDGAPAIVVEGRNVADDSDGLHGELFGEGGWLARFSKYGAPPMA